MDKTVLQVLLVEDNLADVLLLREALAQDATVTYRVTNAERVADGIAMALERRFDAVLLDLGLPDAQGLETFTRFFASVDNVPVLVLSGMMDMEIALQAVQAGAQDYIVKGQDGWSSVGRIIRYAIERQQTQAVLRASERRFRAMIEHISDGIVLLGPKGNLLYESPASKVIAGPPLTSDGSTVLNRVHPDDRPGVEEVYRRVVNTPGLSLTHNFRIDQASGEWRWLEATATNMLDEPAVGAVVLNYHDITERMRTEMALRQWADAFVHCAHGIAVGMPGVNNVLVCNPAFAEMHHTTPEEIAGRPILSLYTPEHQEAVREWIHLADMWGRSSYEAEMMRGDGSIFPVQMDVVSVRDEEGTLLYRVATAEDITVRKRAETLLHTRLRLSELSESGEMDDILHIALDAAEALTSSKVGFFHFVADDQKHIDLQTWSSNTLEHECKVDMPLPRHYPVEEAGVWVECLEARAPVIHNDYAGLAQKKGLPPGHAQITRELTVPIFREGLVKAIIGVGNKATNYTQEDVEVVQELASISMDAVMRRRIEDELRERQAQLRESAENMSMAQRIGHFGSWEIHFYPEDRRYELVHWSEELTHIFGIPEQAEQINMQAWLNRVHPDDRESLLHAIARTEYDRSEFSVEHRIILPDGTIRQVYQQAKPIVDEQNPRLLRLLGTAHDITEPKQIEDTLRKRTEELMLLLEAGRVLSSTLDLQEIYAILHRFIAFWVPCDTLAISLYDPGAEQFRYQYIFDHSQLVDPSTIAPDFVNLLEPDPRYSVFRGGEGLLLEHYRGPVLSELSSGSTDRTAIFVPLAANNQATGVLQIFSDTPGSLTEDHLRFVEALLFREVSAMSNAELFQRLQVELDQRRQVEEEIRELNAVLEQRVADRTAQLSRTNEELERAARAKDEFLANMSHELRTPLNAILTLAESLEEGIYTPLAERQKKPLHTIAESGYHLLNLINDVLDLSKIEAGKVTIQIATVEVEPLCNASIRLVKQQAQKKRLDVTLRMDMGVPYVNADARLLKQMLMNLLSNAVKFTPEGGHIGLEVEGDPAAELVYFHVWDTGIGITPEQAKRLFVPFVQVDAGLARQYGGTGLGLSLVLRMAELHGGTVKLVSRPGEGSRFTISLPWTAPGAPLDTGPLDPQTLLPLRTALLIENSLTSMGKVRRYLSDLGALVSIKQNADLAVAEAHDEQPDVILLDATLPGISSWEVLGYFKTDKRTKHIPVIVLLAEDERERAIAFGASDALLQPVSRSQLYDSLRKVLHAPPPAPALPHAPAPARGASVLIVEDNQENQAAFSDYLTAKGYRALLAGSGHEAITSAQKNRPDVILMDIQMPGMDGIEAIRRLRADPVLRDTPIIALTALTMPGDRERCMEAGANDYLSKPVSLRFLIEKIEAVINARQVR